MSIRDDEGNSLRILLIDVELPSTERRRGGLHTIELMLAAGHRVTVLAQGVAPRNEVAAELRAGEALLALGVDRVFPQDVELAQARGQDVPPEFAAVWPTDGTAGILRRGRFDVAWLGSAELGDRYIPILREHSPGTRSVKAPGTTEPSLEPPNAELLTGTLDAAVPARWQARADSPWLDQLLRAYADAFPAGGSSLLVLTVAPGAEETLEAAAARITETAGQSGVDLDAIADVELTAWREDLPTPARTVFWRPPVGNATSSTSSRNSSSFIAGTVATSNFLPWVRVIADSFKRHNPGTRFVTLLLDEHDPAALRPDDQFELVTPTEVGLLQPEYGWMDLIYVPQKLVCAVKPWFLEYLLQQAESALYIDNDMLAFGQFDDIGALARRHGVVLTPHSLEPLPDDGLFPDDDIFLEYGQFNAGFVAVGREEHGFLDYWKRKLRRDCTEHTPLDPYRAGDQRWLDMAVGYFPIHPLRDPGVNVGYWNLGPRRVTRDADSYTVNGVPLRLMHFSGYDPSRPEIFSRNPLDRPRPELSSPAVLEISAEFSARLHAAGWAPGSNIGEVAAGIALTKTVRRAIREALVHAERQGLEPAEGPTDPRVLLRWLRSPAGEGPMSWYLWGLHGSQPQIAATFGQVPGPGEARYVQWAMTDPGARQWVPAPLAM